MCTGYSGYSYLASLSPYCDRERVNPTRYTLQNGENMQELSQERMEQVCSTEAVASRDRDRENEVLELRAAIAAIEEMADEVRPGEPLPQRLRNFVHRVSEHAGGQPGRINGTGSFKAAGEDLETTQEHHQSDSYTNWTALEAARTQAPRHADGGT